MKKTLLATVFAFASLACGDENGGVENPLLKERERAAILEFAESRNATLGRPSYEEQCGDGLVRVALRNACGVRSGRDLPQDCPGELSVFHSYNEGATFLADEEYLIFWESPAVDGALTACEASNISSMNQIDHMVLPREEVLELIRSVE